MILKYTKRDPAAVAPTRAHQSDAGFDLVAVSKEFTSLYTEYDTGLVLYIPEGYVGLVFPRSSISGTGMALCNAVGVVDSGYRGTVKLRFRRGEGREYKCGEKVGQLIVQKLYVEGTEEVMGDGEKTTRGAEGFGSTGR